MTVLGMLRKVLVVEDVLIEYKIYIGVIPAMFNYMHCISKLMVIDDMFKLKAVKC